MQEVLHIIADSKIPLDSKIMTERFGQVHPSWIEQSNMIRILNKLSELGAIREVTEMRRGRMYIITKRGKSVLKMLASLQKT